MKPPGKLITTAPECRQTNGGKGFALVTTVSMLVLLTVLAVGMLSLASISTRSTDRNAAQMEAEANARMALAIAIGQLQETLGPDRRISARAATLARDPRVGASVAQSSPKAWWLGVAGTDPNTGLDCQSAASPNNPAAVWLVSGLTPGASAASQLGQTFNKPVDMYDAYSIDLSLTGGQPLQAGIVETEGANPQHIGGYAWIVDDEGMKGALAPSDRTLVNVGDPSSESDLTPGAYDVSVLGGMSPLQGNPLSNYTKIMSTGDLALVGGSLSLAADKRLGYTTSSRGVLCDVKRGGLKHDLTAAFENDTTFNAVFPAGNTSDYLLIEQAKLDACDDLKLNGYIHWDVFKDHYNIKRWIKTDAATGIRYLDPVRHTKAGCFTWNNGGAPPGWAVNPAGQPAGSNQGSLFMAGRLGPHDIGNSTTSQYPEMNNVPYGEYRTDETNAQAPKNHKEFKHSPVIPILQRMQMNAWMEQLDARTLRLHAQLWSSHYNPYNIALLVQGMDGGPRIMATPKISAFSTRLNTLRFRQKNANGSYKTFNGNVVLSWLRDVDFTNNKYQFSARDTVMALPGRAHVLAYESSAHADDSEDGFLYNDKVKDLTVQSVYRDVECETNLPASFDLKIRASLLFTSLHHGLNDNNGGPGNFEVCQSLWAPFAWDNINGRPGKEFDFGSVTASTLNENKMAMMGFNLRTTREPSSTIRPLVDANIRCMFGNTRWDSPLGVPSLAAYSVANQGVEDEMIMQMSIVDSPRGYTYWGAGRDPSYGYDRVILFDIPRSDLVSLGQLQHAGAGRFSYEPTYIVGNSYANPRIAKDQWKAAVTDTFSTVARGLANFPINGAFNLYDASYLVNEVLWDRYTFTTIPQVADNVTSLSEPAPDDSHFNALAQGDAQLPNARYLPYAPAGSKFDRATLQMASNKTAGTGAFYHNAGHVLVDGAFNVNSTSVDAWEAFLSSTHSLPVAKVDAKGVVTGFDNAVNTVRFPRTQSVFGQGVTKDNPDEDFWTGFRALEQSEVRELAQAIADEVVKRGPFLSMADFVNRKLVDGELGECGALQAALDRTVNRDIDTAAAVGAQATGFPGQLLQGDVLQALAPRMAVRSDTFTIRAYGECVSSSTGRVLARAWCEAKIQRMPDPVASSSASTASLKELSNPTSPFGRQFRMISFRWLNPNEI
ncbi:MAG TPA: hypothetical protein VFY13_03625 [Luteolibacter sp.]|nr:hypothetical protein [Luteolibacter sp.]